MAHPLADYPLLYNSTSNIVDLATIPMAMVDHIDIVPGNQSAIYGSSAIAGVVNIVLKQNVSGHTLNLRGGGYSDGGGGNQRLQFVGGERFGKLDVSYALEYSNQSPIYRNQRSYMDSLLRNPTGNPVYPNRDYLRIDGTTGRYIDPGKANCDRVASQYDGSVTYAENRSGRYCGSYTSSAYATILNQQRNYNGYVSLKYPVNDQLQLYGDLLYNDNRTTYTNGFRYVLVGHRDIGADLCVQHQLQQVRATRARVHAGGGGARGRSRAQARKLHRQHGCARSHR